MGKEPNGPELWEEDIQKRYEYLEYVVGNGLKIASFGEFVLAYRIAELYHFGPRHELNRNGRLHADLIKLTDKWGYKEKK